MRVQPKLTAYMQWTVEMVKDRETKDKIQNRSTEEMLNDQETKGSLRQWIAEMSKGQVAKVGIRIFASFLVAMSGLILFTDKVTTFGITSTFGFRDTQTFIWALCQSFSPLILILGSCFKPFRIAYTIPGYIYFIQIYWVFHPEIKFDDVFLQIYAIGFVSGFTTLIIVINY